VACLAYCVELIYVWVTKNRQ